MASYPDLRDRRALVTGGAAGIGEAVSRALALQGARVAVLDRDRSAANALARKLRAMDTQAIAVVADASEAPAVRQAVDYVERPWGGVDLLVNAAGGIFARRRLGDIEEAEWDAMLAGNLKSAFLTCQAVLPGMQARGYGRIVNVASDVARSPVGITGAHYAAAKSGLLGLTRHLAREVAAQGIRVNAIAPAVTLTPRITRLYDADALAAIEAGIPLGRIAGPEEPGAAVLFLLSDAASYITGACLDVTGGRVMV